MWQLGKLGDDDEESEWEGGAAMDLNKLKTLRGLVLGFKDSLVVCQVRALASRISLAALEEAAK